MMPTSATNFRQGAPDFNKSAQWLSDSGDQYYLGRQILPLTAHDFSRLRLTESNQASEMIQFNALLGLRFVNNDADDTRAIADMAAAPSQRIL
jgi:hypothetical protein